MLTFSASSLSRRRAFPPHNIGRDWERRYVMLCLLRYPFPPSIAITSSAYFFPTGKILPVFDSVTSECVKRAMPVACHHEGAVDADELSRRKLFLHATQGNLGEHRWVVGKMHLDVVGPRTLCIIWCWWEWLRSCIPISARFAAWLAADWHHRFSVRSEQPEYRW